VIAFRIFQRASERQSKGIPPGLERRNAKNAVLSENHCALDAVLKFAHIAGPGVVHQSLHRLGGNRSNGPLHSLCGIVDKVLCQARDILAPSTQRRQGDGEDVEAIEEIHPERLFLHQSGQVSVGRGDHADVNSDGASASEPFECLFL